MRYAVGAEERSACSRSRSLKKPRPPATFSLPGLVSCFIVFCALLGPTASPAVVTFDLLHDTPDTRETLKEELSRAFQPADGDEGENKGKSQVAGELEEIWFAREKFLQIGEKEKARGQLNRLWEREMELGIRNLPEYGEVLVREARREVQRGQLEKAEEVLATARKVAPEFLPGYLAQASLVVHKSIFDFLGAGQELVLGVKALERSFRLQSWAAINLLFILSSALAFFFSGFVGLLMIRHAGRAAHDLAETLPMGFSMGARKIIGWLLLLLPLLLGFPVWWWFIIAGMMLLPYIDRISRALIFLAMLYLLSLPWQVRMASSLLSLHRQPLLESAVSVREDHWDSRDYAALKEMAGGENPSFLALSAYGLSAKRLGMFEEAEAAYRAALEIDPDEAGIWNNLGTLALNDKRIDEAIDHYRKAIEASPDLFAPHYNVSLAYREQFLFSEGETESRRAAEIDPQADAYYTTISGEHFNRYAVDELPALRLIWQTALSENKWQRATANHLWRSLMLVFPREVWNFVLVALALLGVGVWAWRSVRGTAEACPKCGRAFCRRCAPAKGRSVCIQCHHIFVRKEGVDAKVRVRKMAEIKRTEKLRVARRIALAAAIPGGGHVAAGHTGKGILMLLPASFFLGPFLLMPIPLPSVWHLTLSGGWGLRAAGIACYVLLWGVSIWTVLHLEE